MSEVTIYCPPLGNTITGECETTEILTWSQPSVEYVQYYVTSVNKQLVAFDLSNVLNNGSSVTIEIIYYRDNMEIVAQTWQLGELGNDETIYHFLDFGTTTGVNNYITLKVTLTGGSTGRIDFFFDCDVQVAKNIFCTGTTAFDPCDCDITTEGVTIYTVDSGGFQFTTAAWYLDPQLQIEAPCLYYLGPYPYYIYYYNCLNHRPVLIGNCPLSKCPLSGCSGGTSSFVHSTPTFNVSNPFPEKYPGFENTLATEVYPNTARFSKHCLVVQFPDNRKAYPVTFTFAYNQGNSVDYRFITLEDAFKDQSDLAPGFLSFSRSEPTSAPFFEYVQPETTIDMPIVTNSITLWIIPPVSGVVLIKFFVGYRDVRVQNKAVMTTTITPSCNGVPFYEYEMGLHVYSAWDALNSPRHKTFLYSFTQLSNWIENSTIVFNDPYFLQPAFPYFYSMSGVTYKIGEPLRRDYGFIVEYIVRKKILSKWKFAYKTVSEFKNHTITDLFSGTKQLPSCVNMVATTGKITNIIQESEVVEPLTYSYIVGKDDFVKLNSNNNFFNLLDPEDKKFGCYVATGFEYALARLSNAYIAGMPNYLNDFSVDIRNRFRGIDEYLQEDSPVGSSVLIGLGFAISASITFGFRWGYISRVYGQGFINGNTVQHLAKQAKKNIKMGNWGGLKFRNAPHEPWLRAPKQKQWKWAEIFQWCWNHPKLMVIISLIIIAFLLILFVIKINKKISDCCKLFSFVYTSNPYIFTGDTVNLTPNLTLPYTSGYLCDGAYFYTLSGGTVTKKELSYKIVDNIKTDSILPDTEEYILLIPDLFFLPFVSGKPNTYVTVPTYESLAINSSSIMSQNLVGELNSPLPNYFSLESGFTTSEISQNDADTRAYNYLSGITAYTQAFYGNITYKPGVSESLSNFTHEIKEEVTPNEILFFYDNTDLSGVTIGKRLFYDSGGVSSLLNGYYATSAETSYKVFNYVLSGTVEDIFVMQNSGDTTVTSSLTGGTINVSQTLTGFTSGWFLTSTDIYDTYVLDVEPNTDAFYNSTNVKRGVIQTIETQETFYTYNTNTGYPTTYSEAEENWYREYTLSEPFFYYQNANIVINIEQVCLLSGDNGLMFKLVNSSGETVNSVWGINFVATIFTASTFDSAHTISINADETEKLLPLSTSYIGQITDVLISGYTSPNPINKTTFVYGGFTGCTFPTPTPTPTITSTETPTPTITSTETPTPTITPTITSTPAPPFISTWRTTGFSESITLPYWSASTSYDGIIDWGDGTQVSNSFANRTHTYTNPGDYEVKIYGTVSGWTFGQYPGNSVSKDNIISISQWGPLRLGRTATREFFQCTNLSLSGVTDVLDLTGKLYLFQTFTLSYGSITTIGRINEWNTSSIINMRDCFRYTSFNDDITTWDVSNNQAFTYMVADTPFNQDISGWNVSKGVLFNGMFSNTPFNYNISSWNVSAATNMDSMFFNNTVFNQDISVWNVSNVTNMRFLFGGAQSFNQPVGVWNVDKVTNMYGMFTNAFNFNQDLSSWNTSKVTNMAYMFSQATDFDRNIGNWNVSGVTNFIDFMALKTDSDFSFTNLDSIYNGWSSQNVKTGITINFGTIKFSQNGLAGKQVLTGSPYNWIITDGGMIDFTPTPTPTITETMTPTPTITETMTPTPTITETMTPTPTPTEQVPTIYLNFCYDANIPEDFAVDVYVYSQTTPSGCGQNQTQVQEVLNITTTIISDSGFSEGYIFTLNPGESCALTSGSVVGSLIDNFIVDSVSPTGSTLANYVVGQICSSGSCITCSGSTPTPTPSMTETPTPTPSMTETPTPTTTTAELATPTPTPTPTTTTSIPTLNMVISGIYGTSSLTIDLDITGGVTPDSATLAFDWCTDTGQIGNATYNINAAEDGTLQIPNINLSSTGSDSQFTAWGSYSYSVTTANLNNPTQLYIETSTLTYTTSDTTTRVVVDFVGVDNSCLNNQNYSDYCLKNCSY